MTLYGTVSRGGRPDSYIFPPLPVERLKRLGARSLIFVSFEENGASVEARPECTWPVRAHGIFSLGAWDSFPPVGIVAKKVKNPTPWG